MRCNHPDQLRLQHQSLGDNLALEKQNESMSRAMAAYIAWRIPEIRELHIDTSGEPLLTEIVA